MRIFKFKIAKLKSYFPFLNPQSTIHIPLLCRHFSLGQQGVLFVLALFILGILYFKFYDRPSLPPEETFTEFVIEVLGEVRNPGIYIFRNSPTIREAIEKAGGFKEAVRFEMDSSPETLATGIQLTIVRESQSIPPSLPPLSKGEYEGMKQDAITVKIGRMKANKLLVFSIPLDLNRISAEDLCLIPGIGESLAQEIVSYREKRKGFRSVEELKNIKGVGEKKYESFKTFFIVRHDE